MEKKLDLTDAEWSVMEQLWTAPGSTGRALTAALEQKTGWSRSTTLTLLRRLEGKQAVADETQNGVKAFRPLIRREEAALQETEDFLSRVYQGSLSLMVSTMTQKQALSQEELGELYKILQELEEKAHD